VLRALVLALALSACAQAAGPEPAPAPAPIPTPAPVAHSALGRLIQADLARLDAELRAPGIVAAEVGQAANLGGGLIVRPYAIVEDSRCPGDATCLWEGRMRIRASVSGRESELTLGETLETPNGAVVFVLASPGPWAEWPSDELGPRPAYRFGFRRG
jgi:hypothetical protein